MDSLFTMDRLVTRINCDGVMDTDTENVSSIEPAFILPDESCLQISIDNNNEKARDFLIYAVARHPGDLRRHVQRINLNIKSVDPDGLYGALLDLFIILKERGRSLRERMFKLSKPILDEDRYQFLFQYLDRNITAIDVVPPTRSSLFSKGIVGTKQLVLKLDNRAEPERDPLEEADAYLEYGQVDEAQQVLEKAILQNPSRKALYDDLIGIYRRTDARQSFLMMQEQLNTNLALVPDSWHQLEEYFAGNN